MWNALKLFLVISLRVFLFVSIRYIENTTISIIQNYETLMLMHWAVPRNSYFKTLHWAPVHPADKKQEMKLSWTKQLQWGRHARQKPNRGTSARSFVYMRAFGSSEENNIVRQKRMRVSSQFTSDCSSNSLESLSSIRKGETNAYRMI